jgi:outer membrane lipoprotein-sorting protein
LTTPLTSPGRVWFAAPDKFRWELGSPAQSLAIRNGPQLLLLSPRLKRAELATLDTATGTLREALSLLDTGFPRDAAEFRRRFQLLSLTTTNTLHTLRLQPRASQTRRLFPEFTVILATNDLELVATEIRLGDGSSLRNDFTNAVRNGPLDDTRFDTAPPAGYETKRLSP